MKIKVLIVEDDPFLGEMIEKYLMKIGYQTEWITSGQAALENIYSNAYDLCLIDIMLPEINGQELLKEIRQLHSMPIIMMTALSDEQNHLNAFENEADDYLTKPFSMKILLAHIENVLRRTGILKKSIELNGIIIYPETQEILWDENKYFLNKKEFELLMSFVQNPNQIVPKERLLAKIWGYDFEGNEGIIHATMNKLREKLPKQFIKTIKGVGYRLGEKNEE
ncbi:response regulator transcription factor [Lysinibacillus sp. CNPSo 3705]|uniref:response regulator transcription factor n=1 Tax=Lysinibacillus sp. CNPSo 3705 TaxID=3028148 RepID=UPI00104C45E9|nr:response regulator transcription factor [Lysinibacillus sp. CNPSo 3705]MDD1504970.1 response regulator transcription factor [Lysinibacillus sp. CNPSo 3705]